MKANRCHSYGDIYLSIETLSYTLTFDLPVLVLKLNCVNPDWLSARLKVQMKHSKTYTDFVMTVMFILLTFIYCISLVL